MNTSSMVSQKNQKEADQMLEGAHAKSVNPRQMMAQVNKYASKGIDPAYFRDVQEKPPNETNACGDGSLVFPTVQWCAFIRL